MRSVILGATGLVGYSLWRDWTSRGWEVSGTYFKHPTEKLDSLDMLIAPAVESYLKSKRPEVVVIASANPFVDYCETHPEETRKVNVDATIRIAQIAERLGAKPVFFSTEYVFPGQKPVDPPYTEEAKVQPLNIYGEQKVAVEQWMRSNLKDYLILRVSGVYGWTLPHNRKNYVMQVLNAKSIGKKIRAATDVSYNPTYAWNLGQVLAELLEHRATGIFHTAGERQVSRHEFSLDILDVFGLDRDIVEPASQESLSVGPAAKRPQYAPLSMEKLHHTIQAMIWPPRQALEHMKQTEKEWNG